MKAETPVGRVFIGLVRAGKVDHWEFGYGKLETRRLEREDLSFSDLWTMMSVDIGRGEPSCAPPFAHAGAALGIIGPAYEISVAVEYRIDLVQ